MYHLWWKKFTLEQNNVCVILAMVIKSLKNLNVDLQAYSFLPVPEAGEQNPQCCSMQKNEVLCIYKTPELNFMASMMATSVIQYLGISFLGWRIFAELCQLMGVKNP